MQCGLDVLPLQRLRQILLLVLHDKINNPSNEGFFLVTSPYFTAPLRVHGDNPFGRRTKLSRNLEFLGQPSLGESIELSNINLRVVRYIQYGNGACCPVGAYSATDVPNLSNTP